jgi:hypothetical protein
LLPLLLQQLLLPPTAPALRLAAQCPCRLLLLQ